MACNSNGWVDLGSSKPKIETCVSKTTKDITITVRGVAGEPWPFKGYARVKLRRAHEMNEIWIDVDTKNIDSWSSSSPTSVKFSNIAYIGSVMEATVQFQL